MIRTWGAALAIASIAAPAAAQFSDSYNFIKAVKDKDAPKAKTLLDKPGANIVNARDGDTGDTALHMVTRRSDAGWIVFLLQAGANANLRDNDGNTPLLLAARSRFTEGVRIYVLVKAQVDQPNRLGETALIAAAQNRDAVIAKMLLDAGANPDITDNSGASARSLASADIRSQALARLLKDVPVRSARPAQGPSL